MTPQQKVTSQILSCKETEQNKLTNGEAILYAQEIQQELYWEHTLSKEELKILDNLNKQNV